MYTHLVSKPLESSLLKLLFPFLLKGRGSSRGLLHMSKKVLNVVLPQLTSFLVVIPKKSPINAWRKVAKSEARLMRASATCHPGSLAFSRLSPEVAHKLTGSIIIASVMDSLDSKPRQLRQAVEAIRCSEEHLQTEDSVSKGPVMYAPRISEGGWLPGPAERQCAFLVIHALRVIGGEWFLGPTGQQPVSPVVNKNKTRVLLCLPSLPVALTPIDLPPVIFSQALHASQPNTEFSGLCMKSPYEGDCKDLLLRSLTC